MAMMDGAIESASAPARRLRCGGAGQWAVAVGAEGQNHLQVAGRGAPSTVSLCVPNLPGKLPRLRLAVSIKACVNCAYAPEAERRECIGPVGLPSWYSYPVVGLRRFAPTKEPAANLGASARHCLPDHRLASSAFGSDAAAGLRSRLLSGLLAR